MWFPEGAYLQFDHPIFYQGVVDWAGSWGLSLKSKGGQRETFRALQLHVKGVLMEGMCHVAGLWCRTAWRG